MRGPNVLKAVYRRDDGFLVEWPKPTAGSMNDPLSPKLAGRSFAEKCWDAAAKNGCSTRSFPVWIGR